MKYVQECNGFHIGQELWLHGVSVGKVKHIGAYEGPNSLPNTVSWICTDQRAFCNTEFIWLTSDKEGKIDAYIRC